MGSRAISTKMTNYASQTDIILAQLQEASVSYAAKTLGAREKLMSLCRDLISNLELPSEALMRMGWAEVSSE